MNAWEKFKKSVIENNLVRAGDKVLIAVSGGPDSVSLLHLFWRLKKTLPLTLHAAYCNHHLRAASGREAEMVIKLAQKLGIEAHAEDLPVRRYAKEHKVSLETAGRTLRYEALALLARRLHCNKIATGHTASDNAETVLMWLIRGTGTEGLAGIPLERYAGKKLSVIRPLLFVTRHEIMAYVKSQKLRYCVDESNFSMEYTRNRIRHELIPLLHKYNPGFVEHMTHLSRIITQENDFLAAKTSAAMRSSVRVGQYAISLDLKRFLRYNKVIQARLLKAVLPERRSWGNIERLLRWILRSPDTRMEFSGVWQVERRKDSIVFRKK